MSPLLPPFGALLTYLSTASSIPTQYPLAVWWKGDDDLEYFTLRCKREDQMRQWESMINRLIKEAAQRRASERGPQSRLVPNSTNPRNYPGYAGVPNGSSAYQGYNAQTRSRGDSVYAREDQMNGNSYVNSMYGGPQGYPQHDGFEDGDEDDFEDYPPSNATSSYASSGRGTPMGTRRGTAVSMPPERESTPGYDRPRAQTEGGDGPNVAQWRTNGSNGMPTPLGVSATTNGVHRPITPRLASTMSSTSYQSDATYNNGGSARSRPQLRSQFSSTRLRTANGYDGNPDFRSNGAPKSANPNGQPTLNRSRSASQPSAYIPKSIPPPLPPQSQWMSRSNTSMSSNNKRGSGSSQSTGDSSEYSPNSSSPITPFGSSESSLGGVGIRQSRSQHFEGAINGGPQSYPPVKVKVHFHEDIFVIQVARSTEYDDLVEKVGRKIRLCGPRRDDGPLRVKYRDEDGDMVSLGSTEDVQMAFEQYRPGGQVTLFVT